jgi:hypothetical protein
LFLKGENYESRYYQSLDESQKKIQATYAAGDISIIIQKKR